MRDGDEERDDDELERDGAEYERDMVVCEEECVEWPPPFANAGAGVRVTTVAAVTKVAALTASLAVGRRNFASTAGDRTDEPRSALSGLTEKAAAPEMSRMLMAGFIVTCTESRARGAALAKTS